MSRTKTASSFLGRWRIAEMEAWDRDYIDMEVKAFIEFEADGRGQFQFGLVRGCIDYRLAERNGRQAVEWSWEGNDECDSAVGRGWALLETEVVLVGRIFFHQGDDSSFRAEKAAATRRTSTSRKTGTERTPGLPERHGRRGRQSRMP